MPTEPVRPRAVSTTPARPATTGRSTRAAKPNHSPPPTTAHGGASARVIAQVERAVLGLLPAAARAGRVPKLLVDPGTGLLRSGTVIDCVLAGGRRYRCSVVAGRTTATLTASREPTGVISLVARHGGTVRGEA
jgi:hypothetical protein